MLEKQEYLSDERIEFLIPPVIPPVIKPPMYHSKFSAQVRKERQKGRYCHKTMGIQISDYPIGGPKDFLKKRSKIIMRPDIEKSKPAVSNKTKVPRREDWNKLEPLTERNHITKNVLNCMLAVPKGHARQKFFDASGHTELLNTLEPKLRSSKRFGKVPPYLGKFKRERQGAEQEVEDEKGKQISTLRLLPSEERDHLLKGMKQNWEELQKEFLLLPLLIETPSQIRRKSKLERVLNELEKEIDEIERNDSIYIYTTPEELMKRNQ